MDLRQLGHVREVGLDRLRRRAAGIAGHVVGPRQDDDDARAGRAHAGVHLALARELERQDVLGHEAPIQLWSVRGGIEQDIGQGVDGIVCPRKRELQHEPRVRSDG